MLSVHNGQCGLCSHFGEDHGKMQALVNIVKTKQAPEGMVELCGLPNNAALHLHVTPISGCDGFTPAASA